MKKKIVIHFFVQSITKQGTYFRFHNLAIGLQALGHTVKIFGATYNKGDKSRIEEIDGIEYDITACYFPFQRLFGQNQHPFAAIKRVFRKYPKCDVSHLFQPYMSAYLPWSVNKKKANQNVYDWDDLWTNGLVKKGTSFYDKWLYAQVSFIEKKASISCNYLTTCSNFLSNKARSFGASKSKILYNGYWEYFPINKESSRINMKLQQGAFYIGFMGRTTKEINWCFDLLNHAMLRYPNVRLALCGMPKEALEIEEHLKSKVDYLGLLPPGETREFAAALDIGLLPLEDDAFNQSRFPIKFAEYLAANTPILCTNVGECGALSQQFIFVQVTGADSTNWINKGLEMIGQVLEKKWPIVDKTKLESVLSWTKIIRDLEGIYLNNS